MCPRVIVSQDQSVPGSMCPRTKVSQVRCVPGPLYGYAPISPRVIVSQDRSDFTDQSDFTGQILFFTMSLSLSLSWSAVLQLQSDWLATVLLIYEVISRAWIICTLKHTHTHTHTHTRAHSPIHLLRTNIIKVIITCLQDYGLSIFAIGMITSVLYTISITLFT